METTVSLARVRAHTHLRDCNLGNLGRNRKAKSLIFSKIALGPPRLQSARPQSWESEGEKGSFFLFSSKVSKITVLRGTRAHAHASGRPGPPKCSLKERNRQMTAQSPLARWSSSSAAAPVPDTAMARAFLAASWPGLLGRLI